MSGIMNYEEYKKWLKIKPEEEREKCPDCGANVSYYHEYGTGLTRVVCSEKCRDWYIIKEFQRYQPKKEIRK